MFKNSRQPQAFLIVMLIGLTIAIVVGLSVSAPFSLMMWLARRAAYLRFQTRLATFGSAFYAILIVIGLFGLSTFQMVSIFSVLMVVGIGLVGTVTAAVASWFVRRTASERDDAA